jgi:O-antigen ligase
LPGRLTDVRWADARAALIGLLLLPLAADHGGYYPPAWGWSVLLLLWGAGLALLLRADVRVRAPEVALLGVVTALFAWILCSNLWTGSPTRTMLESQRAALYIGAVGAILLLVRGASYRALLGAAWCAIALVCGYALATRLFPERLGITDVIAGYRLSEPVGYWNALGLFAAMGALLALGFVTHGRSRVLRAAAGASLVILIVALYFTFSRGAWGALACGLVASIALERQRLRAVTALLAVAPWPALGVWIGSRSEALTRQGAALQAASDAGHRLALVLVALAAGAALVGVGFAAVASRVRVSRIARGAYAAALLLILTALMTGVFARYGSPVSIAERGYRAFTGPPPATGGDLNRRLFTFSSVPRAQQWTVAWQDYRSHPWLGSGAGTYELHWLRDRPSPTKVVDAHSLYLETLAELGPVGLLLVLMLLGLPLAAAAGARRRPLAPAAFGAYVAYLLHAGVDWDWEMTALTLTALICGAALLLCVRGQGRGAPMSGRARAVLLALTVGLSAFSFLGFVANHAISASTDAARAADRDRAAGRLRTAAEHWDEGETQVRRAARWAPWSTEPWRALADAQLLRRDRSGAAASFRRAIAKEPNDWSLWYGLARASRGRAQRLALRRAARLNPLSPEVAALREQLGLS